MPDNGGCRRGLACPNSAKTHFHERKRLETAFSLRRFLSVLSSLSLLFFRSDIHFSFIVAHTQARCQAFEQNFQKAEAYANASFFLKNKFVTLYSAKARSIIVGL